MLLGTVTEGTAGVARDTSFAVHVAAIDSLLLAGELEQALTQGRRLRVAIGADESAPPWQATEMQQRIATLERMTRLPADAVAELVAAAGLDATIAEYYQTGDFATAEELARQQRDTSTKHLGPDAVPVGDAVLWLSRINKNLGDHQLAAGLLQQAKGIFERAYGEDHPRTADCYFYFALLNALKAEHDQAIANYSRAKEIYRRTLGEESNDYASVLEHLSKTYRRLGQYDTAVSHARRALEIATVLAPTDDGKHLATYQSTLACAFLMSGEYRQAEQLLTQVCRCDPDDHDSLNSLAVTYIHQGEYAKAIPILEKARSLLAADNLEHHPSNGLYINNLAAIKIRQGKLTEAEALLESALYSSVRVLGENHPKVALALENIGGCYYKQGKYAEAEQCYNRSVEIRQHRLGEDSREIARMLGRIGTIKRELGSYAEAESLQSRSVAMNRSLLRENHPEIAKSIGDLAGVHYCQQRYQDAESLFAEAVATTELTPERAHHPDLAVQLTGLGQCQLALGRASEAEEAFARAAAVFERARWRVGEDYARSEFIKSPYRGLAAAQLLQAKFDLAWYSTERALGRSLADLLAAAHMALNDDVALPEDRVLPLAEIQNELAPGKAVVGWLNVEIAFARKQLWGYVIRDDGPVRWISLDSEQAAPPHDAAPPQHDHDAFATPTREFRERLVVAGECPDRVARSEKIKHMGSTVYDRWFAMLTPYLDGVQQLIVIPDSPINGIPIEALRDERGRDLVDVYAISYAPSATTYAWLRRRADEPRPYRSALLIGDPAYRSHNNQADDSDSRADADTRAVDMRENLRAFHTRGKNGVGTAIYENIPWAEKELRNLATLFPSVTVLTGAEANEMRLDAMAASQQLAQYEIIHIASHAYVDDQAPENSCMVLSNEGLPDPFTAVISGIRVVDSMLTAKEIVKYWRIDADLVTLSGCQTGLGKEVEGEGYIGLTHAFLQAGARSMIVSLWRVEDEATCLLMNRFYENLTGRYMNQSHSAATEPMNKVQALQEAKTWLRELADERGRRPFQHPAYWSSFVLVGDPD